MFQSNNPYVSVVIPTLNEEKYLRKCLVSLQKQTYKNFEIIISDNNSTDRTVEIAKKFDTKVVISLLSTIPSVRQRGIKESSGDIIIGGDADTEYQRDHIERIVNDFKMNPHIVAVGGPAVFSQDPFWVFVCWSCVYCIINPLISFLVDTRYIPAFNLSFKRTAFQKIGGYSKYLNYGGDEFDIINRLKKVGEVYYDSNLHPVTSNRRARVGPMRYILKEGLIDYYLAYMLAKIFKKTIIKGSPVR